MSKIYLKIPFQLKDRAKALGARWDPAIRQWYSEESNVRLRDLQKLEGAPVPEVEGFRTPRRLILPELVPEECWYSNLRSELTSESWDAYKRHFGKLANWRCQITGTVGPKHPTELHEVWRYDDKNKVQHLEGLVMLAPDVHLCMHPGFAAEQNKTDLVLDTMVKFNSKLVPGYSRGTAEAVIQEAFEEWRERSNHWWQLDISYLDKIGIPYEFKK